MTVDGGILHSSDASFLVGRANPHRYSLFGNAELNASFRDRSFAMQLLRELLGEHLDTDVRGMDDRTALRLFRTIARENRARLDAGNSAWQGMAYSQLPSAGALRTGTSRVVR